MVIALIILFILFVPLPRGVVEDFQEIDRSLRAINSYQKSCEEEDKRSDK